MADNFFKVSRGMTLKGQAGADPSNPVNGDIYYNNTLNQFRKYENGSWSSLGSGAGGGGAFNYIGNPDAEADVSGWTVYANTTPGVMPDNFGGSPSGDLTFVRNTSSPLSGQADFLLSKIASNTQGEGVYYEFDIDRADFATMLTLSGRALQSGNYEDGDIRFYLVSSSDNFASNFNIMEGTPRDLLKAIGVGGFHSEWQTHITDIKYRFCVHVASTSADAYDIQFDRFSLGPTQRSYGAVITYPKSYTPSFNDVTFSSYEAFYERVGDKIEIDFRGTVSGTNANPILIGIPDGLSIDTDKIPSSNPMLGKAGALDAGVGWHTGIAQYSSPTRIRFAGDGGSDLWNASVPFTWVAGDQIQFKVKVPIVGWSSNTEMSSDTATRVVAGNVGKTANQSIPNNDATKVTFDTVVNDRTGSWDSVNNRWICGVSGEFVFNSMVDFQNSSAGARELYLYKNGSLAQVLAQDPAPSSGNNTRINGTSSPIPAIAGDYLEIFVYQNSGDALNLVGSSGVGVNYFGMYRLSGPTQIAASETVAMKYKSNSAPTINNTTPVVGFNVLVYDNHNAYNAGTGEFTVPIAGKYRVSYSIVVTSAIYSTIQVIEIRLYKNGSFDSELGRIYGNGATNNYGVSGSTTVPCIAGDILTLRVYSAISNTLLNNLINNNLSIERIGN